MYPTLFLEPLRDVYLRSTRDGSKTGNINNVYIFSIIAVFILLIACINFINLTTARSAERAKEVGIRKVVGAEKSQLTRQFIGESLMLSLIAFVFTLALICAAASIIQSACGKNSKSRYFFKPVSFAYPFCCSHLYRFTRRRLSCIGVIFVQTCCCFKRQICNRHERYAIKKRFGDCTIYYLHCIDDRNHRRI